MSILATLFEHKAWCDRGLVAALRAAPAEADRRQMAIALITFDHAARVDRAFQARLMGQPADLETVVAARPPDLGDLESRLAETDAWYVDYARRITPAELDQPLDFTFIDSGEPGRLSRGQMLAHVITHAASHRGAIGKLLELAGIRGAPDMVTTFERERAAAAASA